MKVISTQVIYTDFIKFIEKIEEYASKDSTMLIKEVNEYGIVIMYTLIVNPNSSLCVSYKLRNLIPEE